MDDVMETGALTTGREPGGGILPPIDDGGKDGMFPLTGGLREDP
jgi:hypothetical protein